MPLFQSWELPSDCPFSRLKLSGRHAAPQPLPSPCPLFCCPARDKGAQQSSPVCPCCAPGGSRAPKRIKHFPSCGYTKGFALKTANLSFSMISLLPLYFQYPGSQGEFLGAQGIFIVQGFFILPLGLQSANGPWCILV